MVMIKYVVLIIASLWVAVSAAHDEHYYSVHPSVLQNAIKTCSKNKPNDISCEQLQNIASRINKSVYQLRINPQEYGKIILDLQEVIARQEVALHEGVDKNGLRLSLNENTQRLQERLAIVKWLESPAS